MHLTGEEERMCAGEEGSAVQMAMGLLVALGRIYEAPRMVRIASAHASARTYKIGGDDKIRWMQELVDKGGRFRVLTTVNPGGVDFDRWQQMGVPETLAENQARADRPYIDLGVVPIGTCLPYMHGNAPRFGEHFSWGGSSGQIFANSVLGGRGTRDGAPAVIAAAITGRTPAYGLHLTENRRGQVLVDASRLDFGQMTRADYGACGAADDETEGIVDRLRAVDGVEVAALVKEQDGSPRVRVSLRSGGADVSAVAAERGGGGHVQAAGFSADESPEEVTAWLSSALARLLSTASS